MTKLTCGECEWWTQNISRTDGDIIGECISYGGGLDCHKDRPACSPVQALAEARIELATVRDILRGTQELLIMALRMNKSGQRREEIMRELREKGIEI